MCVRARVHAKKEAGTGGAPCRLLYRGLRSRLVSSCGRLLPTRCVGRCVDKCGLANVSRRHALQFKGEAHALARLDPHTHNAPSHYV